MIREIIFYESHFSDFYLKQRPRVQKKIEFVLDMIRNIERVPVKFLKHLTGTDGLYEIRIHVGYEIFRIFCCFDEGNLVVLFNGFQKKSQKTPKNQIATALKIKRQYFEGKNKR